MWIMAFLVAGSVALAVADLFDDDEAASQEPSEEAEDETPPEEDQETDPSESEADQWEGEAIRVTEAGGEAELVDPTESVSTVWELDWSQDRIVPREVVGPKMGFEGGDEDSLIETNRFDDIHQSIDAGMGLDQVVIGPGDSAGLRSESFNTADDIEGEGGDMLVVHFTEDDLAETPTLRTLLEDDRAVGEAGFSAGLGSEDILNVVLPDDMEGTIHVLEGTETHMHGSSATGAITFDKPGFVFFAPEGVNFPTTLRYDEGTFWDDGSSPLSDAEQDGILYLGTLDLGYEIWSGFSGCYSCEPGVDEVPGNHTEGHDRLVDTPILMLNGDGLGVSA